MDEKYILELEDALTRLLDLFDPSGSSEYLVYNDNDEPFAVSEVMSQAVDYANQVMYGDQLDED